jgi:hypothetical protein
MTLCPECFAGLHFECIGQGCYCDCTFDEHDDYPEYVDCHLDRHGNCGKAGSEECEFECPYNGLVKN